MSFNIPYPPDYGGVIDVYYKIKALYDQGIEVILHCFEYGREHSENLKEICFEVNYYERPKDWHYTLKALPYIVSTRNASELKTRLLIDNFPILFEGLHSTFFLPDLISKNRNVIVRTHNIEHEYYKSLANAESNIFKKLFFNFESKKLKNYEIILRSANHIAAISPSDKEYFNYKYGHSILIPAFHPHEKVEILDGKGKYALFHGDLSVSDNIKSALFLINEVFDSVNIPFIIAGKNPDKKIFSSINDKKHIKLVSNPDESKMNDLLTNAHVNILTTYHGSGIKLKLLSALYKGRHCLVNKLMVENTGLEGLCHIASNSSDFKNQLNNLFNISFDIDEIGHRKGILNNLFNVNCNVEKLIAIIFP